MNESIGMRYIDRVAHGNAGEFYFAYWISSNFIWPCRILDIDMGLDAQIEIYDEQNHSTGMFIAVQVKTTKKTLMESPAISVPLKNIAYWESISDPVVIIRVCLNNNSREPCLYWKHLERNYLTNTLNNAKGNDYETASISFEESDLLVKTDKPLFLRLFLNESDVEVIEGTERIRNKLEYLGQYFENNTIDGQLMAGYPNHNFAYELNEILNAYEELATAVKINPRLKYLSHEVNSTIECYNSHIAIILNAFTKGWDSRSIYASDLDGPYQINSTLHSIMNG